MIPDGRTSAYAIFRACERFNVRPPGIEAEWDEMDPWNQEILMAYHTIREHDEMRLFKLQLGAHNAKS